MLKIKRALISVSDKTGLIELAREFVDRKVEILASGGTLRTLTEAGISARSVESFSGNPEAFQGRMKTLSFKIFSAILARRGDPSDEKDRDRLGIPEIDAVIVNFYPFEKSPANLPRDEKVELIDIGGPALVRAAAKNSPNVLVVTDPSQYGEVIDDLRTLGAVRPETAERSAACAWGRVLEYDRAISVEFGEPGRRQIIPLKYGENPHQTASFEVDPSSPIHYGESLTPNALSYNNILDASAAYRTLRDVVQTSANSSVVVIVKHGNPCGVAAVSRHDQKSRSQALLQALELAWKGDPTSAFGGVIALSDPLTPEVVEFLGERFIECVLAPGLSESSEPLRTLTKKRKGLRALRIDSLDEISPVAILLSHDVVGGTLRQIEDRIQNEEIRSMTGKRWPETKLRLAQFGISLAKNLKSNGIAIVGEAENGMLLMGAGQGQPNRIDALEVLAVARAKETAVRVGAPLNEAVLVSDAFFPFADSIQACERGGIHYVVEPGGSVRDEEVILEAKRLGIELAFTGVRHFLH